MHCAPFVTADCSRSSGLITAFGVNIRRTDIGCLFFSEIEHLSYAITAGILSQLSELIVHGNRESFQYLVIGDYL